MFNRLIDRYWCYVVGHDWDESELPTYIGERLRCQRCEYETINVQ